MDFRSLMPLTTMKDGPEFSQYIDELKMKIIDREKMLEYPPRFHVIIHKEAIVNINLNFKIKLMNSDFEINFHVVAVAGIDHNTANIFITTLSLAIS